MLSKLKALGLLLAAIFVLSCLASSMASAANGRLTSTGPVTLTIAENAGETNAGTAFGGTTKCPGSVGTGHKYNGLPLTFIPVGAETVTVNADIAQENCNVVESGVTHKMTITMNECDSVVHIGETTGIADTYRGTGDIVCPAGKSITEDIYFSASNENLKVCETTIGPQTGLSGTTVTDNTNGTLSIHGTTTGIHMSKSGTCGAGTTETAEADVHATVSGKSEAGTSTSISLSHL